MDFLRKHKITMAVSSITVVLTGIGSTIWLTGSSPNAPDPKQNPKESIKFIASKNFNRLSMTEKKEYVKKFGGPRVGFKAFKNSKLSENEKKALRNNMRPVMREVMKERMKEWKKRNPQNKDRRRGDPAKHMKSRMEGTDSDTRAQFMEFHKQLREEMKKQNK
ncbi:MAG: hypothetical protein GY750_13980 [Lentisphaerae bacterium]|nr:hypothetical protein [Lentisphaerota bacterium]MCP4102509.1 hypothetical protein [Lentisphaerota bacterium]